MDAEHSIEAKSLSKFFGRFKAVDDVNLEVKRGEIYGFLGANGAGKSTTIRMLCGLLTPTSGYAKVAGYDVAKDPEMVKQHIGYMAQKFSLYSDLTVNENITFYGGVYKLSPKRIEQRKREVAELLDLEKKFDATSGELPRGFQQRLAFACAILHEPDIIFLDEPTAGVDPLQRRNFWEHIYNLASQGVTIFVTTHYLDEAEFCNRITLIAAGKIIATDTPSGLKSLLKDFEIFEVTCEPTVVALETMQKAEWVIQASIFGSSIHVSVQNIENPVEKIRAVLSENNVSVIGIERILPSLEDVFLKLVEDNG